MDLTQRIHLLFTFLILIKEQEPVVESLPVPNSPPPFNVAEDVYVTQMYNVSVCVIDGTPFEDGEPIPTTDPCESCICHPPGFACRMIRCKSVPQGCVQRAKKLHDCCASVTCDETSTHNLVYRIGTENETIVWSTEEPPINEVETTTVEDDDTHDIVDDLSLIVSEKKVEVESITKSNDFENKNQTMSDASESTNSPTEAKFFSTSEKIATLSEVSLDPLKIASSSEIPSSTVQIATTDLTEETSNVSKDHLITKQLTEPTTMVVNYSIQLIVDSATVSPNGLQEVANEVRKPQNSVNISLPAESKGTNELLRKPLNIPSSTTLSLDIEVNKPEASNETSSLIAVDEVLEKLNKESEVATNYSETTSNDKVTEPISAEEPSTTTVIIEESLSTTASSNDGSITNNSTTEDNSDVKYSVEDNSSTLKTTESNTTNAPAEITNSNVTNSPLISEDILNSKTSESTADKASSITSESSTEVASSISSESSTEVASSISSESSTEVASSIALENSAEISSSIASESTQEITSSTSSEITENSKINTQSETTSASSHIPPALARSVENENKFGQPEVSSNITQVPDKNQNSEDSTINKELDNTTNTLAPSENIEEEDKNNQQNYNSFIPSGPIIFSNDNNFINDHGMRPRDIETTTQDKNETQELIQQTEAAVEKLTDSFEATTKKNVPEISPKEETITDQVLQETTTFDVKSPVASAKPIETEITKKETSTKQLESRHITTTEKISESEEPNELSDEVKQSSVESSVELENICPHYKRKLEPLSSEESTTSSSQESSSFSEQTEKTSSEDSKTTPEQSTESMQPEISTANSEPEAPRALSEQTKESSETTENDNQLLTSTEQAEENLTTKNQSEVSENTSTASSELLNDASTVISPKVKSEQEELVNKSTTLSDEVESVSAVSSQLLTDGTTVITSKKLSEDEHKSTSLSDESNNPSTVPVEANPEGSTEQVQPLEKSEKNQTHIEESTIQNESSSPLIQQRKVDIENQVTEELLTENSSTIQENSETTVEEISTSTEALPEPVMKIEIIPSEAKNISEAVSEKQTEVTILLTELTTMISELTSETKFTKVDIESEKSISEIDSTTSSDISQLVTTIKAINSKSEDSSPELSNNTQEDEKLGKQTEKPIPQIDEPVVKVESSKYDNKTAEETEKTQNLTGFQTQALTTLSNESESLELETHTQPDPETSKKDLLHNDFQQSTTEAVTSSPWSVVMETIFSSVEPSSYDPLKEE